MKSILLLLALTAIPAWAQGKANQDSQPASTNVPNAEYPRIYPDGRVEVRVKAPLAQKIQVQIGATPAIDMVKGEDGLWSVVSPPIVPGFHYYYLTIDGVTVSDPASYSYYGVSKDSSGIDVPERGVDFYLVKDVPHGEIREHWYHSKATGSWRRCFIYTPPGYDAALKTRYPVLYLQHGGGEDETGWIRQGHANFILDNLIAAGQAKPMIIVMDSGYAMRPGAVTPPPSPSNAANPNAFLQRISAVTAVFDDVMIGDLIPEIDAKYRTLPDREHRAMAGLSMGGMQTLEVTMKHTDTFSYVGGFSGADLGFVFGQNLSEIKTAHNGVWSDPAAFGKKVHLLWLGLGTEEPERMHTGIMAFHNALEKAGVKHVFYLSQGTAHEWQTWRRDLKEFAPLLFRAGS